MRLLQLLQVRTQRAAHPLTPTTWRRFVCKHADRCSGGEGGTFDTYESWVRHMETCAYKDWTCPSCKTTVVCESAMQHFLTCGSGHGPSRSAPPPA